MNRGENRPKKRQRRVYNSSKNSSESTGEKSGATPILPWKKAQCVPVKAEKRLLPLLMKYGSQERGMMCKHPQSRINEIHDACRKHGIRVDQALSLRRTHIMNMNPYNRQRLNLGTFEDIRASAAIFEDIVKERLINLRLCFFTEDEQKERVPTGALCGPTPDFLFHKPVHLKISDEVRPIFCIEAKMFYGASTIPHGSQNAVGKVLEIGRKYKNAFGPGAIVFSFGCGERMKVDLEAEGIFALDSRVLDLRRMYEHQRTWCATANGKILP